VRRFDAIHRFTDDLEVRLGLERSQDVGASRPLVLHYRGVKTECGLGSQGVGSPAGNGVRRARRIDGHQNIARGLPMRSPSADALWLRALLTLESS